MATDDMRQYAERLHATDPARFDCNFKGPVWSGGAAWWVRDETRPAASVHEGKDSLEAWWAFWGPLGSEFGVSIEGLFGNQAWPYDKPVPLLEAIAEAVCQEAEGRKEVEPTP